MDEWYQEDGRVKDASRCGNPNPNPELFSDAWGKGTVISTKNTSNYENKRMAKINFHQSMNHTDRSLFHAYRDIDEACHTLPENVLKDAKMMYRKFNVEKLTRGAVDLVSKQIAFCTRVDFQIYHAQQKKLPICLVFKARTLVAQHKCLRIHYSETRKRIM